MGDRGPGTRGRRCVHDPIKYLRKDWPEVRGPRATTAPLVIPAGARLHSLPRGTPARAPSSCQASPTATPGAHLPLPSALPLPMVPLSTPTRRDCPHLRTPETHTLHRGPPLSLHPSSLAGISPPRAPGRPAQSAQLRAALPMVCPWSLPELLVPQLRAAPRAVHGASRRHPWAARPAPQTRHHVFWGFSGLWQNPTWRRVCGGGSHGARVPPGLPRSGSWTHVSLEQAPQNHTRSSLWNQRFRGCHSGPPDQRPYFGCCPTVKSEPPRSNTEESSP